ncbi:MAG: hypothetical protein ACREEW_17260 [Caulobacteraceae bacterium]
MALPAAGVVLALAVGAALRLCLPLDIEWKGDERWTWVHALSMIAGGAWPPIGMQSSAGAPNPGLSLWVFAGLIELFHAKTPPELARAVQTLNVAALLAFAAFALVAVPRPRRAVWFWALALWAVNPVEVVFERKIWPPSILPLGIVAMLWAWRYRRFWPAAFAWGALGALMAQIHLGVIFLALAFAAWTLARDASKFPWEGWLAGSLAGAALALPWLFYMAGHGAGTHMRLMWPSPTFFMRWATQPFGFGIDYSLHKDFGDFLAGPRLGGTATHIMFALEIALGLLLALALARAALAARRGGWPGWRAVLLGDSQETVLIAASIWGYGGLLTLLSIVGSSPYRHYMIVIAPFMALWAASLVQLGDRGAKRRWAPAILVALCLCQAGIAAGFLAYVDAKGVIAGDFGASWKAQQAAVGFSR